jgi:heme a synthase
MTALRSAQTVAEIADRRRRWTHRIALLLCALTLVLLAAGALVVGTGSSLAVPDWPLAYGQLFPPMVGGILFEHGHRMIATTVGMLTVILAGWMAFVEPRRWVRWLGFAAIGAVVLQGVLGGITVLLLLPKSVSTSHALLAQLFFVTAVMIAQVTAPAWPRLVKGAGTEPGARVRWLALTTLVAAELEILLGALVRHNNAGLVIPDFPLALGQIVPPIDSFPVAIHFAHRAWALVVFLLIVATAVSVWRNHRMDAPLKRRAVAMVGFVLLQIALGASVIWTQRSLAVTTLHVVNGGLVLATTALTTLRAWMLERPAPVASSANRAPAADQAPAGTAPSR